MEAPSRSRHRSLPESPSRSMTEQWPKVNTHTAAAEQTNWRGKSEKAEEPPHQWEEVLANDRLLLAEVNEYLDKCNWEGQNRRELLHHSWQSKHFRPHQEMVSKLFEGPRFENLRRARAQQSRMFMDTVDRKGHIFLDSYAPDDKYDPFLLSKQRNPQLQVSNAAWTGEPTSFVPDEERSTRTIRLCNSHQSQPARERSLTQPVPKLKPLGRHGTTCASWDAMQLTDIGSRTRHVSQKRLLHLRNVSKGCDKSLMDHECPGGRDGEPETEKRCTRLLCHTPATPII